MNLTLSKRGDYVVRSALSLARAYAGGASRKIREVVAEMGVPQTFASQILKDLVRAELATSRAGKDGGYRLARPPEEVTLLEVVEAGEGPLRAERCALGDGPCRWDGVCPLHETWRDATAALRGVLAASTLADLVATDRALEAGVVVPPVDSHRHVSVSVEFDDRVEIELPRSRAVERMERDSWLLPIVKSAFDEVDALRARIDPGGPSWAVAHAAVAVEPAGDEAAQGPVTWSVSWDATTIEGLTLHGEAVMELTVVDGERTELRATGRLRPPAAQGRGPSDPGAKRRLGEAMVRTWLRRVATVLETTPDRGHRVPVTAVH